MQYNANTARVVLHNTMQKNANTMKCTQCNAYKVQRAAEAMSKASSVNAEYMQSIDVREYHMHKQTRMRTLRIFAFVLCWYSGHQPNTLYRIPYVYLTRVVLRLGTPTANRYVDEQTMTHEEWSMKYTIYKNCLWSVDFQHRLWRIQKAPHRRGGSGDRGALRGPYRAAWKDEPVHHYAQETWEGTDNVSMMYTLWSIL